MAAEKISVKEKFAYGLGDTASNIVFQAVVNVLMYFYTDVYGIEAAAAGTLMIVVRLIDSITDPAMGAIADRTRTSKGRYRPWMLWVAIPYGAFAVFAFITPNVSTELKLVYAYISYTLLMASYTAINIPYSALGGVMTEDYNERTGLQSWRFGMAMVGGFLVSVAIWPLSRLLGGGGEDANLQLGFPFAMAIMAVIAIMCLVGCYAWTNERYYPDNDKPKTNVFEDLGAMFGNSQWLIAALAMFIIQVRGALQGGTTPYYIKYYLTQELTGFFSVIENVISMFMGLGMFAGLIGVIVANRLILKMDWCKVSVMKFALTGTIITNIILFYLGRESLFIALAITMLVNFFHLMFIPLLFSTIPDTVDYGLKTLGKGAMAMFFAGQLFALKAGISVGGGLTGWLLSLFGYQANVEQTESALLGIKIAFAGSSVVAAALILACLQFYKLKKGWKESLTTHLNSDLKTQTAK